MVGGSVQPWSGDWQMTLILPGINLARIEILRQMTTADNDSVSLQMDKDFVPLHLTRSMKSECKCEKEAAAWCLCDRSLPVNMSL